MTKPVIINETPITIADMKVEIEKIKKRDNELNFRATKTEEYLQQFELPSEKKIEEMKKKIESLNVPRLKDIHIVKILDLMPTTIEEMKGILSGYTLTVTQENMKKILGVLND